MEKIDYLIRIPNHLGDCIMALPAVKSFVELKPHDNIALLMPQYAAVLYDDFKKRGVTFFHTDYLHGYQAILHQVTMLGKFKITDGLLLTPSFSSALIFRLAGVKNRYGYPTDRRSLLLNNPIASDNQGIVHRSENYRKLFESAFNLTLESARPKFTVPEIQKQVAGQLLQHENINETDKFVVIAPQAIAESRRWGTDNYAKLAGRVITEFGCKIVLVGTSDQVEAGNEIVQENDNIVNLCGQTNIALAAAVLDRAKLFIGNDSGLAHLAAAVDIPLVVLSGADNPAETSPLSDKKQIIIKANLDCISCVKNRCPKSGDNFMRCMTEISVDEVFEAVSTILKQ